MIRIDIIDSMEKEKPPISILNPGILDTIGEIDSYATADELSKGIKSLHIFIGDKEYEAIAESIDTVKWNKDKVIGIELRHAKYRYELVMSWYRGEE